LRFFNLYDKKRLSKRCEIISFEHTLLFFFKFEFDIVRKESVSKQILPFA